MLRFWKRSRNQQALDMARLTLTRMARGGMYDQLGGGFHRYSVDRQWLVPHFEKMLYDNGQLASLYLHAWLATEKTLHEGGWGNQRILPSGIQNAAVMVICDMPDPADGESGALLSGDAGLLFDAMLAAIGMTRQNIYLASLSLTRAPGGMLHDQDMQLLATRMRHQIALAAPRRILLLGDKTNRALLAAGLPVRPSGLQSVNHPGGTVLAIASRHPRSLLRFPEEKANSWRALQYLIEDLPS